jgi:hypothetical protein
MIEKKERKSRYLWDRGGKKWRQHIASIGHIPLVIRTKDHITVFRESVNTPSLMFTQQLWTRPNSGPAKQLKDAMIGHVRSIYTLRLSWKHITGHGSVSEPTAQTKRQNLLPTYPIFCSDILK